MDDPSENLDELLSEWRKRLSDIEIKSVPSIDPTSTDEDTKATEEAKAIASDKGLDEIAAENDHHRTESLKDALHKGALVLFWIGFAAILIAGSVWFYHFVAPTDWHFLEPERVTNIFQFLFGGFVASGVSGYASKALNLD